MLLSTLNKKMTLKENNLQTLVLSDYRGDCWKGYHDVSLRLQQISAGEKFRFICSASHVANIIKVIECRNGQIDEKRQETDGIVFTVSKKRL